MGALGPRARGWIFRRGPGRRAALVASLDDPAFEPEAIRAGVLGIAGAIDLIWSGERAGSITHRPDYNLLREWAAQIVQAAGRGVRLAKPPVVKIIGVVNRDGEDEDRIVAHVKIVVRRDTHSGTWPGDGTFLANRRATFSQRWTLMRHHEEWYLASAVPSGYDHSLFARARIPSAVDDSARLNEAALRELAQDRAPRPAELIAPEHPATEQLTELAVLDQRFSPLLIETTLKHLIECWEIAGVGSHAPLEKISTRDAIHDLRHPAGEGMTRTIHDASLKKWTVIALNAAGLHPTIAVELTINCAWRNTGADIAGHARGPYHNLTLVWTLALRDAPDGLPEWRLVRSGATSTRPGR